MSALASQPTPPLAPGPARHAERRNDHILKRKILDGLTVGASYGGAALTLVFFAVMAVTLLRGAWPAMAHFGARFIISTDWDPTADLYGALPSITGTLITASLALFFAVPVSVGAAIFIVRIAPRARGSLWIMAAWIIGALAGLGVGAALLGILVHTFPDANHLLFLALCAFAALAVSVGAGFFFRASKNFVSTISFLVELLAAIPSVAFGLWGIALVVPFMQKIIPLLKFHVENWHWYSLGKDDWGTESFFPANLVSGGSAGYGMLTSALILTVMVVPIITAITRDVLRVVPPYLEQGAYGVGATWWQATKVVLDYSKQGIFGAVILGLARAIGETMAVAMLLPSNNTFTLSLLGPGSTMTTLLATKFREAPQGLQRESLLYIALILLVMTVLMNMAARWMVNRVAKHK